MDKTIQRACTFLRWHYPDQVMGFGYRFIRSQPRTRSTPFFIFPQRLIAFLLYLTVSKSQEINRFCGKNHIFLEILTNYFAFLIWIPVNKFCVFLFF